MAVDINGTIYLGMKEHIEIYGSDLSPQKRFTDGDSRSYLTSIAVGKEKIFVADAGNKRVLVFDKSGKFLRFFGEKEAEKGRPGLIVYQPYLSLAVSRDGKLWVVNPGLQRVESYDEEGNILTSWGQASVQIHGFCGCCNPSYIALLSDGCFVTSEKALFRIKIYSATGQFLGVVAGNESFRKNTEPLPIAVDSSNRILALDSFCKNIRIFIKK